jgi:hypothetical protein
MGGDVKSAVRFQLLCSPSMIKLRFPAGPNSKQQGTVSQILEDVEWRDLAARSMYCTFSSRT